MTELNLSPQDALSVVVVHQPEADPNLLQQISYGLEEEGIPAHYLQGAGDALGLAHLGASASSLGVGIGIDSNGTVSLTHFRMPPGIPVMNIAAEGVNMTKARMLGINAARLVKGNPFQFWKEMGEEVPAPESPPRETQPGVDDAFVREIATAVVRAFKGS
ncbi:MAG TPA: hypothetical protein GX735_02770 [Firmicutes bacterium]|jgi:hypothetical protein|nr:hypothetical protein [Bacillota bacterium]